MTLARAFMAAGAAAVVGTLGPMDDEQAAALFAEFYRARPLARTDAEALRLAQLHFLRDSRSIAATSRPSWPYVVLIGA